MQLLPALGFTLAASAGSALFALTACTTPGNDADQPIGPATQSSSPVGSAVTAVPSPGSGTGNGNPAASSAPSAASTQPGATTSASSSISAGTSASASASNTFAQPSALPSGGSPDSGLLDASPAASSSETLEGGLLPLPDPGTEGDGNYEAGPDYAAQPELSDQGAPKGRRFEFSLPLAESAFFDGTDATLDPSKPVNSERSIVVYVPAAYVDGTPAPLLVIQDGPGDIGMVQNALDNLTRAEDPARKLPAFIAIAVQNGGNDAQGSQRGLEYDTMSDRYARFINDEILPAVVANSAVHAAYPNLAFTTDPSGRATLGCSSGGAAALTMAWFRPDLFSRVITYSGTFVDQQDHDAPEVALYPDGAWGYHSNQELIKNSQQKPLRIFLNVNENDLRSTDPESTLHNWVMANERTAAALAEKGYHYRYVFGRGVGHCDGSIRRATLADALVWVWRGYQPVSN